MDTSKYNLHTIDDIRNVVLFPMGGELVYRKIIFNVITGLVEVSIKKNQWEESDFSKAWGIVGKVFYNVERLYYSRTPVESKWSDIVDQYLPQEYRNLNGSVGSICSFEYYEGQYFHSNKGNIDSKNYYCWVNSDKYLTEPYNELYDYQQDHEGYNPATDELAYTRDQYNKNFAGYWSDLRKHNTEERSNQLGI